MPSEKIALPTPWQLQDRVIDGAVINNLSFQTFSEYIAEAMLMKKPKTIEARLKRLRLARQVTYYINGSTTPVTPDDVTMMPIPNSQLLISHLNTDPEEGKAGKVIKAGDGINSSIIYELGTPIQVRGGKPITELEFLAKTYGEVEDVLSATDSIAQTAALIATVAKPPGMLALPSWALGSITMADGITIAELVTPHFLGQPVESQNE